MLKRNFPCWRLCEEDNGIIPWSKIIPPTDAAKSLSERTVIRGLINQDHQIIGSSISALQALDSVFTPSLVCAKPQRLERTECSQRYAPE